MTLRRSEDRILLVDDLALVRRTVPARLASLGCKISSVASAAEAWEWLDRHKADLLLLDVVLPGKDGFTFCRELKADPRWKQMPVIMLTDVSGNILDRSLEAGADDYLPKRADDAYLRTRIHLHLHLAELRRQHPQPPPFPSGGLIHLATRSSLLQAQLPSQLATEGYRVSVADRLDAVGPLTGDEALLIVDMGIDPEGIHPFLSQLRMEPSTASLPVLVLCEKGDVERLASFEFMVNDVLTKPLTAQVNRYHVRLLLEMAHLSRQG